MVIPQRTESSPTGIHYCPWKHAPGALHGAEEAAHPNALPGDSLSASPEALGGTLASPRRVSAALPMLLLSVVIVLRQDFPSPFEEGAMKA